MAHDRKTEPLFKDAQDLLDIHVRPSVNKNGSDIILHTIQDGVAYVKILGTCANNQSQKTTLTIGVEDLLRRSLPQIIRTESIK